MHLILEDVKFLCSILEVLRSKRRREVTLREINIARWRKR